VGPQCKDGVPEAGLDLVDPAKRPPFVAAAEKRWRTSCLTAGANSGDHNATRVVVA
jgi:hypothetical protein